MAKSGRQRKRRSVQKKPVQKMVDLSGYGVMACVSLMALIVVSGLSVVQSASSTRALYQVLGEVQREHDQLLEEHSRLSLERGTLSSLQKIETVALEDLEMQFPTQIGRLSDE